ncbi:hypothetical protein HanXRQr2_Chr17g0830771 [Helianthus annuus]|uniref:Uncharacterized protein n=1 Tax=Helianthus annuus TaxID=4232 RepID=A0A9K3GVV4_HELAN|nr:hypothetical protein HanXRQr2_Chr17g0830771 [Helianthus annuus]
MKIKKHHSEKNTIQKIKYNTSVSSSSLPAPPPLPLPAPPLPIQHHHHRRRSNHHNKHAIFINRIKNHKKNSNR